MDCKHPPHRLFCGSFYDIFTFTECYWIGCCECGEVLRERMAFKSSIPNLKKEIEYLIKEKEGNKEWKKKFR